MENAFSTFQLVIFEILLKRNAEFFKNIIKELSQNESRAYVKILCVR
jgi:hypothetical protein